jgi:asparagine synthase (glutamine-hydrolysing)
MCGIAGWVDFARDLRVEQPTIRAMTGALTLRGPDAEGVWLAQDVALGHRRLAVIDVPGGAQPMTVEEDSTTVACVTYSGELYNFRELRTQLRSHGHRFRTASDTEVLLRAYLQWGLSFVDRLNGMYAFALWDPRRRRLVLGRDRMGIKPLHYHLTPTGVLFASEPKALLIHPAVSADVDAAGLREALSLVRTPGRSVLRDVAELRPGHLRVVEPAGARQVRYWALPAREHVEDLPATIRHVRELLADVLERQLIADVPLCTLLSGGLDSSAVSVLAAAASGPVRSFSVDFAGPTREFDDDPMRGSADAPFVRSVVTHAGLIHRDIVLDSASLIDPLHRSAVLRANDGPKVLGDMYTSLYLLFRAVREHSTVALSGESADELFGGYEWFHDERLIHADTYPWLAALRAMTGAADPIVDVLAPDVAALLDLPTYQADGYRQALTEVEHLPGEDRQTRRMREVSYLNLTRFLPIFLDRKDRMSMANGLEVRVPFCDHRLVEYVYNAPWSFITFAGREKRLRGGAAADLLPEPVRTRRKTPYPATRDPSYERALRERAAAAVAGDGPVTELVDPKRIATLLEAPLAPSNFAPSRRSLELILNLNEWLRYQPVRLRLDG